MSFLREYLPAPLVDFLPLLVGLLLVLIFLPRLTAKIKDSGIWDQVVDKVGGDKYRQIQFERTISRLLKRGDVMGAAELYEDAEWYPEAIDLYLKAEEYTAAGQLYEKLEQWDHAAEMYAQADDWKRAANIFTKSGKPGKAAELNEENGQKIDAAKLYFEAGRFDRAAELYEEVSYHPQAAKCYENMGEFIKAADNYEKHWSATTSFGGGGLIAAPSDREAKVAMKAGQLYEQAGALDQAASLYKRAGLTALAAELAAKMGRYEDAGEMFLKEEKLDQAAGMFDKAGNTQKAALIRGEVAFHQGESAHAAEEFLEGGDHLRAAELFESIGDMASAAKCYEQSDSPLQAANVYLRAGKRQEAAAMFEQGRDFQMAAKLFEEAGEKAKASMLFEEAGQFYQAGKLAYDLGDPERAILLLQKLESDSENYEAATLILSRLFIDRDLASLAVEKLIRVLGDRAISSQTLEHFYSLGRAYEKLGKIREAIETFKKVMAERYGYEDVEQRLNRLTSPTASLPQTAAPARPTPTAAPAQPTAAPVPKVEPSPPAPAAKPAAPPIQVKEQLGQGLLGPTFKGVETRNGSTVAIKFLREDLIMNGKVVERFLAEARAAKAIQHPNLVRLLGLTEIQGKKAAVMEYVEGFNLAALVQRNKRLSIKQGLDLLSMLCVALGQAHKNKLLHRDLKMTNILVAKGGGLRLTGVGLGALRTAQLGPADGYPPPELLNGQTIDPRSDIYSVGALIFHCLSGLHPLQHRGALPSLRTVVPDAPEALDEILARCMSEQAANRFSHVGELFNAVKPLRQ